MMTDVLLDAGMCFCSVMNVRWNALVCYNYFYCILTKLIKIRFDRTSFEAISSKKRCKCFTFFLEEETSSNLDVDYICVVCVIFYFTGFVTIIFYFGFFSCFLFALFTFRNLYVGPNCG